MEINDIEVITQILKGNKEQYALLIRKYNQRLYRIGKGYLKEEDDIEDVMQETYIKAYQGLSGFENRAQFGTWITRIFINECLQKLRKMKHMEWMKINGEHEAMNYIDKNTPERESLNKELKALLEGAISNLSDKYRVVFMMREVEKMSVEETSLALDITAANVKIRLNRAKEMLRNELMNAYPLESLYDFHLVRCNRVAVNVLSRI